MKLKIGLIIIFATIITVPILMLAAILTSVAGLKQIDILISTVSVLMAISFLNIIWVYRSILLPLSKLQEATRHIKEGNLDFTLDIDSDDEIGQLCMDFEEMRIRLKENEMQKLQDDKDHKELISNISHDLKTPITAIKGYVEGIMDGVAASPTKLDKYIRTIYNKANDMDKLIDELTFYTKIDTNRIPYNYDRISIVSFFRDCSEELKLDMEARTIRFHFHNNLTEDVFVIADVEQLKRVVNNIISNSLKHLDKAESAIGISLYDDRDFVKIDIEDNGSGIAAADLPFIFDRFYRVDSSRNLSAGGSGIGLSIVKKIIEDHNGHIWASSKEFEGTHIIILLRKYQEVNTYEEDIDSRRRD